MLFPSLIPLPYKILGALVAALVLFGSGYLKGHHDAGASWQIKWDAENARIANEKLAEADRQAAASLDILNHYSEQHEKDGDYIDGLTRQLEDLQDAMAKKPGRDPCRLDADDVKRLRGLSEAPAK